ncbi:peptidase C13 family-domain-containing protein [Mycena belliarum]|uniref:Peptidase C13 family-domain-containing protein n=1 Tax=Mycena belliarum TaxID=1033014 RepID=A0AAD6XMS2_9AGAR|nr:peptidase C13 family-domain-containing protein [Mycena belliae]
MLPCPRRTSLYAVPHILLLLILSSVLCIHGTTPSHEEIVGDFFNKNGNADGGTSDHTNNWAVLVCASRYWFNYRHMANALGMYRTVKRLGIPDSNIILMLADDVACNARNKFPGSVYAEPGRVLDLYGENIEVDYRGYEVTVENFIRVLTGRMEPSVPRSKRLLTDASSNVFVYMTGHGGNEFLKFQDNEEISAFDIADAFEQMWQKRRYNEIFFMIDTCQANTMYSKFYSPNILATGSSKLDQSSYSYENDNDIGVSVIDRYTHYVLEFMERVNKTSHATMKDLFDSYDPVKISSDPGVRADLFTRPLDEVRLTDFFGGVARVEVGTSPSSHPLPGSESDGDVAGDADEETRSAQRARTHVPIQMPEELRGPEVKGGRTGWRAWCGLALLGALVGWVGWSST